MLICGRVLRVPLAMHITGASARRSLTMTFPTTVATTTAREPCVLVGRMGKTASFCPSNKCIQNNGLDENCLAHLTFFLRKQFKNQCVVKSVHMKFFEFTPRADSF